MNTSLFNYDLPKELIAQTPIRPRDHSRLLCLDRNTGEIEHKHFYDIIEKLNSNDLLVVNNSKVIPARILGTIEGTSKESEVLLLRSIDKNKYECIVRPGKKLREGSVMNVNEQLKLKILEVLENGNRVVEIINDSAKDIDEILNVYGMMPLPPYITEKINDNNDYQTVYASKPGSAAAPTAGFHFTEGLIDKLKTKGVDFAEITLHIGLGTFRPVKEEKIENHLMHREYYNISSEVADKINNAKVKGKRIIAVGTTSVRTLEASFEDGKIVSGNNSTDIFIFPGYEFKVVDGLITNFHLPESTLIMLVSAFAGYENTMKAYKEAVSERYRFYSFGDAMFIS